MNILKASFCSCSSKSCRCWLFEAGFAKVQLLTRSSSSMRGPRHQKCRLPLINCELGSFRRKFTINTLSSFTCVYVANQQVFIELLMISWALFFALSCSSSVKLGLEHFLKLVAVLRHLLDLWEGEGQVILKGATLQRWSLLLKNRGKSSCIDTMGSARHEVATFGPFGNRLLTVPNRTIPRSRIIHFTSLSVFELWVWVWANLIRGESWPWKLGWFLDRCSHFHILV